MNSHIKKAVGKFILAIILMLAIFLAIAYSVFLIIKQIGNDGLEKIEFAPEQSHNSETWS